MSLGTASAFLESRRLLGAACGSRLTRAGTASAFLESRRLLATLSITDKSRSMVNAKIERDGKW